MEHMSEQLQGIRDYFEKRTTELDVLKKLKWKNESGKDEPKEFSWNREEFDELLQSPLFVTEFPDKLLDRKFRELLQPFIFEHGKKTIFCKLDANNEEEDIYLFSACTEAMRDTDEAFFQKRENYSVLDILYKPYLYELSVEKSDLNMEFERGVWYEIGIKKRWEEDETQDAREENVRDEGDGRDWIKDKVSGHLTYGASPLVTEIVYLEWRKKVNGNISLPSEIVIDAADVKANTDKQKIDQELDIIFKGATTTELRVYRVGQANFTYGYNNIGSQQKCFAFDIGIPTDGNLYREAAGKKDKNGIVNKDKSGIYDDDILASMSPEMILISHWHQDHYKGAYILKRDMYRKSKAPIWITPIYEQNRSGQKPENECYNADRLVAYLLKLDKILFTPDRYYYSEGDYMLCSGEWDHIKNKTNNHNSLLLQMSRTLLPGDCVCECWPSNYATLSSIDYIIVPHHGSGEFDESKMETRLKSKISRNCKAIICVGKNNTYNHPGANVDSFYRNTLLCKEVIQTKDVNKPSDTWITNP